MKLVFEVKDVEAERSRLESLGIQTLRRPWQKAGEACDDRRVRLLMESRPPLELGAATQDLNPRSEGRQIRGHIGLKLGVEMSVIEIISFVLIEAVLFITSHEQRVTAGVDGLASFIAPWLLVRHHTDVRHHTSVFMLQYVAVIDEVTKLRKRNSHHYRRDMACAAAPGRNGSVARRSTVIERKIVDQGSGLVTVST